MSRDGGQKFSISLETQGKQTFDGISRDFGWDIPGAPEKFEKRSLLSISGP